MKKWPLAAAVTAVAGLGLARGLATGTLPAPPLLSNDVSIPEADPPDGMAVAALRTGMTKLVAAFAYTGGSPFERRDFAIGSVLVRHPRGDLLVDAGFGRDIDRQFATMPRPFRWMTRYEMWRSVRDQLEDARYDFDRLGGIVLTHAHWDHVSGVPDFPGVPVLVSPEDKAAFQGEGVHGYFAGPVREMSANWCVLEFGSGPYLGFPRSHDVYGDGSIVCVSAPGHTPGSIIVFVTLPGNVRYALLGDLVWQRDALDPLRERPALVRRFADWDAAGNRRNLLHMASVLQRIPELIPVPAHDRRAFAELPVLRT